MSKKLVSIKNLAIINHNGNHYRVNFTFIRKKDAYNLIKNAMITDKKGTLKNKKNKIIFVCGYYKDGFEKNKIGDKEVNKKEFYSSKQAISLDSVDLDKIVVSNKCKINNTT